MSAEQTWSMIHAERAAVAELLDDLTPDEWAAPSLVKGWTVRVAAAHILAGAEQTTPNFMRAMAASGLRFNVMIDRAAHGYGQLEPAEIVTRLRARTTTTNHPPAPIMAMLGEVVVHAEDVRTALDRPGRASEPASTACLAMYEKASFPVGGKKRIAGLTLRATDADWSGGAGPEVAGPSAALLLAMTGRRAGLARLTGPGVAMLSDRIA